jgi:hypothetical protein
MLSVESLCAAGPVPLIASGGAVTRAASRASVARVLNFADKAYDRRTAAEIHEEVLNCRNKELSVAQAGASGAKRDRRHWIDGICRNAVERAVERDNEKGKHGRGKDEWRRSIASMQAKNAR